MRKAPNGFRLHIGLSGRRNLGKPSLLNAMTRQNVSIVSEVAATTTGPVQEPLELLPIGPVLLIETAGIERLGALGQLHVAHTSQAFHRTDVGLIVGEAGGLGRLRGRHSGRPAEAPDPRDRRRQQGGSGSTRRGARPVAR